MVYCSDCGRPENGVLIHEMPRGTWGAPKALPFPGCAWLPVHFHRLRRAPWHWPVRYGSATDDRQRRRVRGFVHPPKDEAPTWHVTPTVGRAAVSARGQLRLSADLIAPTRAFTGCRPPFTRFEAARHAGERP